MQTVVVVRGVGFHTDLNNQGEIATVGIVDTDKGNCQDPTADCYGLGRGVYTFDRFNRATLTFAVGGWTYRKVL